MDRPPDTTDGPGVSPLPSTAVTAAPAHAFGPPDAEAVLASLPDAVIVLDAEGRVTWGNRRAEAAYGWTLAEVRGRSVLDLVHPDDHVTALASLGSVQDKALGTSIPVRVRHADDTWIPVEARGWSGVHDPAVRGVVVVLRRIDDRGAWSVASGDARRHAAVLDQAPSLTLLVDSHGRLEGASRAFTTRLGLDLESSLGRYLTDLVVDGDARRVRDELARLLLEGGARSFEATFRGGSGRTDTPCWLSAVDLLDDLSVGAVVISGVEIAPLVEARERLAHQATHDPLTGLANRKHVMERLDLALAASVGTTACVGLVFCDIDGFKEVNDAHGHLVGDEVLVEISRRLGAVLRDGDTAGRLGGDEIVVVAIRDSVAEVEQTTAAVAGVVEEPIATSAGEVRVRLSAGCAVARQGGRSDEMLRRADEAMYSAKRNRG